MKVKFLSAFILIVIFISTSPASIAQWVQTSGPDGGTAGAFAYDGYRIYAGMQPGGVFISTNNGQNWQRSNSGLPAHASTISFLLVKDDLVFAVMYSPGVYVSSDSGNTWQQSGSGLPNSTMRFIGKAESYLFIGVGYLVYRSTDNGASWAYSALGIGSSEPKSFYYKDSLCFVGTSNGFYVSDNFGDNWSERSSGLINKNIKDIIGLEDYLFVYTDDGIYRSSDNGLNWTMTASGFPYLIYAKFEAIGSDLFVTAGDWGVYRSTDMGLIWDPFGNGYPESTTVTLLSINSSLFAGNSSGIYSVEYPDTEWVRRCNGLYAVNISCSAKKDNIIHAGGANGQIFISSDYGESWITKKIPGISNSIKCIALLGDTIFTSSGWLLYYSTDGGDTWFTVNLYASQITSLAIRDNEIYVGTSNVDGVWRSTDGGNSWMQVNNGLTNIYINAVETDEVNVYVGTQEGLFISSDNGNNWVKAAGGFPTNLFVTTIKAFDNTVYAGGIYGLYRSTNYGSNWQWKGFSNQIVQAIEGRDSIVFAGTVMGGVFLSTNYGNTWNNKSAGLPDLNPSTLVLINDVLFTGIRGHSMWKNSSLLTGIKEYAGAPDKFILYQNYPNPFNPSTSIRFTVSNSQLVTLKVFDILGKEVAVLLNKELSAGHYEVEFDGRNLSSGIYFYRLQSGEFSETRKMILMR